MFKILNYMIFCFTFQFQMFPTFEPHIGFLVSVRSLALHMDREKDRHFSPWEDHNALSSDKFAESLFEYARSPTVSNICTINICNNLCFDESVHFWIFLDFSRVDPGFAFYSFTVRFHTTLIHCPKVKSVSTLDIPRPLCWMPMLKPAYSFYVHMMTVCVFRLCSRG